MIFPEIPPNETTVLDVVHGNIKSQFVHDGLMVAQCHARCDGSSMHSPGSGVHVAVSTYRDEVYGAARHSVSRRQRVVFRFLDQRFGSRFKEPEKLEDYEKPLIDIYRRAKARFVK